MKFSYYLTNPLIASFFLGLPAFAQPPVGHASGETKSLLKLEQIIDEALSENQQLKAAEAELKAVRAKVGPAAALDDPILGITAKNFPEDTLSSKESGMTGVEVSLSQKLPFPGKRGMLRAAASHLAEANRELLEQKRWELKSAVTKAYYELYLAVQKEELLKAQRTIIRQVLAATRNQYSLGKLPQAAVLNLQVEEAKLLEELLKAESEIKIELNELSHLLGHTEEHLSARPAGINRSSLDLATWSEAKIVDLVLNNSPRLKAMAQELKAQDADLSYAKRSYLPDFQLMVGYTFREPTRTDVEGKDFVSAGVGISLPIWAGSKQSEIIKSERAETAKVAAEFKDLRLMLEHEARASFVRLLEAKKRIELFDGGLLQMTAQAVSSNRSAYLTGKVNYTGLLDSLRTQYNTQFSYQEALARFETELTKLQSLAGQELGVKTDVK